MDQVQQGIIALLAAAVTGEQRPLPEEFALETAHDILCRQSLIPLAYQGAYLCGIPANSERMQQYRGVYLQNLLRSERQMRAVEEIFHAFQARNIAYLPLKGCCMKALYPQPEMRVMGDADILIRPEQYPEIAAVMESLGFVFRREDDHVYDWYSDALHVELHKSLVPPRDEDYFSYFGDGWQRAVSQQGSRYAYSAEDTFVFLFSHFARHYRSAGIGCRHVVDLYVYLRANPGLDEAYLVSELSKLHLLRFYDNVRRLLLVWFCGETADEITELITAFVFSGGNWGTMEAGMYANEVQKAKKRGQIHHSGYHAVMSALFPPKSSLTYRYTVLRKAPWLLPVIWVVRWTDILLLRRDNIKKRLGILKSLNNDTILTHRQAMEKVGLEEEKA